MPEKNLITLSPEIIARCRAWGREVADYYTSHGDDREACLPWSRDEFDPAFLRAWLASREEAGRAIDIETCELGRWAAQDADPYGIREMLGELPEEMYQVGTNRFVRSPESHGWISEDDLPPDKFEAMYARIRREWSKLKIS
jgi:hypothetical protein